MNTHRVNITLPRDIWSRLQDKPNKSAFIAQALREKLGEEERRRREEDLAAAYRQATLEEAEEFQDWEPLAGDGL